MQRETETETEIEIEIEIETEGRSHRDRREVERHLDRGTLPSVHQCVEREPLCIERSRCVIL
jgi:hypothetical protein